MNVAPFEHDIYFAAVSIEEEGEEEAVDIFMLLSRVLKEEPFQDDKCTLRFKRKNISIFLFFRRVTVTVSENDDFHFVIPCVCFHPQQSTICLCI
jgi:hypothetical protein